MYIKIAITINLRNLLLFINCIIRNNQFRDNKFVSKIYSKLLSVYAGNRGNVCSSIFLGSCRSTIWRIKGEDEGPPSLLFEGAKLRNGGGKLRWWRWCGPSSVKITGRVCEFWIAGLTSVCLLMYIDFHKMVAGSRNRSGNLSNGNVVS